jgi:hypothetical protein
MTKLERKMKKATKIVMNKKTFKAVQKAKIKYETLHKEAQEGRFLSDLDDDFPGVNNCSLCGIYNTWRVIDACVGCPIKEVTNATACGGTPYNDILYARGANEQKKAFSAFIKVFGRMLNVAEVKKAAKTEVIY